MGIFEKLFGKNKDKGKEIKSTPQNYGESLKPTSKMLAEEVFWKIVEESFNNSSSLSSQESHLIRSIQKLSPEQIIGFRLRTDSLLYQTYNSEMWCAGYIMNGGCSDDMFEYFRNWIISLGKEAYYKAKENPDSLIYYYDEGIEFYEFEEFWYVALEAFKNKTGKDLYDYIDPKFEMSEYNYPEIEFTWSEEEPESMKNICPKLYDRAWK